eukprot:CAMPEP_0117456032 /NCGR_PEP_ID=MMETSP0759-20121206/11668_1 /TAXON_ID=63605 /ORGANISM="Percolomonas cosmopolitus, Strain WS" /LENGTH=294 /DNA_ID=CAMNT_0005249359 /DNA_START=644 /DNA_END=1528 /DNA_ORIENTATION=+
MKDARKWALQLRSEERDVGTLKRTLLFHYWQIPQDRRLSKLLDYMRFDSKILQLKDDYSAKQVWKMLKDQGADVSQQYIYMLLEGSQHATGTTKSRVKWKAEYSMEIGRKILLQLAPEDRNVKNLENELQTNYIYLPNTAPLQSLIENAKHDTLISELLRSMSARQVAQELHSKGINISEKYIFLVNRESHGPTFDVRQAIHCMQEIPLEERTLDKLRATVLSRFGWIRKEHRLKQLISFSEHDNLIKDLLTKTTPQEAWTKLKSQNIRVSRTYVEVLSEIVKGARRVSDAGEF